jgi:hypothetical protein
MFSSMEWMLLVLHSKKAFCLRNFLKVLSSEIDPAEIRLIR